MALSDKIKNDIGPFLLSVLQGYGDHIGRCDALIAAGIDAIIEDGNTPAQSRELHLDYRIQLSDLLASAGILQSEPFALPQTAPEPIPETAPEVAPEVIPDAPAPQIAPQDTPPEAA
jgi:hypothetical protein